MRNDIDLAILIFGGIFVLMFLAVAIPYLLKLKSTYHMNESERGSYHRMMGSALQGIFICAAFFYIGNEELFFASANRILRPAVLIMFIAYAILSIIGAIRSHRQYGARKEKDHD